MTFPKKRNKGELANLQRNRNYKQLKDKILKLIL